MSFDQVRIEDGNGNQILSREEWLALSSFERVRQFLQQQLQFLRSGEVIPMNEASGWLHLTGSIHLRRRVHRSVSNA